MTRHVPTSEFKNRTSEPVAAAGAGEEIVITRDGKPTVMLRPASSLNEQRKRAEEAMARLLARREAMRAAGKTATVAELIAS